MPIYWWLALMLLAGNLPDLDILMLRWLPYAHPLSHRGFSHSLFVALVITMVITISCRLAGIVHGNAPAVIVVWLMLFAAMASHGLVDALTDGGLGISLLSPFNLRRYFFPVRPIPVASINPTALFSPYMLHVYAVEAMLFGPFCLAAWLSGAGLFNMLGLSIFRWLIAAIFFFFGVVAWIGRI